MAEQGTLPDVRQEAVLRIQAYTVVRRGRLLFEMRRQVVRRRKAHPPILPRLAERQYRQGKKDVPKISKNRK